ncbi:MAG: DEAD/DEAH box helicase [Anaerolineae bacterium]|nr:DEAD/DEAH box helicase [Anaerolineae bacterium]
MEPDTFLGQIKGQRFYRGQIVHLQRLPARKARYGRLHYRLSPTLQALLEHAGAPRLYTHQAQAINAAFAGQHVVVATSTASGKTLCYNVPVLETLLRDPAARALYLFPTKALAQDQLGKLNDLLAVLEKGQGSTDPLTPIPYPLTPATYDGDTPRSARGRIRRSSRIILTNPDMLHVGILPNHHLWADFFRGLRYVVLDEAHQYRGVFGSQVACVLRRLRRVCAFYGSRPQFSASSATIANPAEHFRLLTGLEATVVDDDGSPHGPRSFVLWNPPFVDRARTARRSANAEATQLLVELVQQRVRSICFTRTRRVAELILRYAREALQEVAPELAERVKAYRAGYLPRERRQIEQELFRGDLLAVTATTALELGIDVGHLDAALLVGYPGTVASFWQQAGRAGRGERASLAVLIGLDNPLDQYFMRHPQELFGRPLEHALVDPDNLYVLLKHLLCAAHEVPLSVEPEQGHAAVTFDDEALFGPGFVEAMVQLERQDLLDYRGGRWFYTRGDYPAQDVSLRSAGVERFVLLDESDGYHILEEMDAATAPLRAHPGAIYLHQGETYLVTQYDPQMQSAIVRPVEVDYYTQPREVNDVRIIRSLAHRQVGAVSAYLGQVRVTSQVIGYRRLQQYSEAVLGEEWLDMPAQTFETVALWWDVPAEVRREVARRGLDFLGGLHGVEHAAISILPLFAMCDRWDIGGLSTPSHPDTEQAQVFIYDGFPGGVGIAEKGFELLPELWRATLEAVRDCPCAEGCPSCIVSPKCGSGNEPLDKQAAVCILQALLKG